VEPIISLQRLDIALSFLPEDVGRRSYSHKDTGAPEYLSADCTTPPAAAGKLTSFRNFSPSIPGTLNIAGLCLAFLLRDESGAQF
jgi:hypothetical protein